MTVPELREMSDHDLWALTNLLIERGDFMSECGTAYRAVCKLLTNIADVQAERREERATRDE